MALWTSTAFILHPPLLEKDEINEALDQLTLVKENDAVKQKDGNVYGIRDLLNQAPALRRLATNIKITSLLSQLFKKPPRLVRAIYFNKTETANWIVPWHQDTTIATRTKLSVKGFDLWTVKAGIHHVRPPVEYLQKMSTFRIHLDECIEDNGALKVIPGSHRYGFLSNQEILKITKPSSPFICNVGMGGIMIMRPLLVHASSMTTKALQRRVLHFEFSADILPNGLEWYEAVNH